MTVTVTTMVVKISLKFLFCFYLGIIVRPFLFSYILVMLTTCLLEFVIQEIVRYVSRSLQEKKLLYFGMENLDFSFIDPVSTEGGNVQGDPCIPIYGIIYN